MLKFIRRIYKYILSNEHPIADFIWQLDQDVDALNALIVQAEKDATK